MDAVFTNQGEPKEKMVNSLKTELDECNIRGGYKNTSTMEYFQGGNNLVINWISQLEGKVGEDTMNYDDGRCCIFDPKYLHLCVCV